MSKEKESITTKDLMRMFALWVMLTTQNKTEFINAYKTATGQNAGASCWHYMYSGQKI